MRAERIILFNLIISLIGIPLLSFATGFFVDQKFILNFFQILYLIVSFLFIFIYLKIGSALFVKNVNVINLNIDEQRYMKIVTIFMYLAIIAFVLNLSRVYISGISIFGSNREYELIFGKYTLLNYIYYFNGFYVSIFPISLKIVKRKKNKKKVKIFLVIAIIALFFHGVKSTIIFPFIIAIYIYWIINNKIPVLLFIFSFIMIIASFVIVNMFIRYGSDNLFKGIFSLILLYLTPSYSNLFEEMKYASNLDMGAHSFDFIIKFIKFINPSYTTQAGIRHFVDPNYNVATIFYPAYKDFGYLGIIFYVSLIALYLIWVIKRYEAKKDFSSIFILGLTCVQVLFIFWGNHFTKFQFIYWIILSIILGRYSSNGTNKAQYKTCGHRL